MITEAFDKLLAGLLEQVRSGNLSWPFTIVVAFLVLPTIWAIWTRYYLLRKIEGLYIKIVESKDEEIKRLVARISKLEKNMNPPKQPPKP